MSNNLSITQLLLCVFRIPVSECFSLLSCSAVPMQWIQYFSLILLSDMLPLCTKSHTFGTLNVLCIHQATTSRSQNKTSASWSGFLYTDCTIGQHRSWGYIQVFHMCSLPIQAPVQTILKHLCRQIFWAEKENIYQIWTEGSPKSEPPTHHETLDQAPKDKYMESLHWSF